MAEHTDVLAVNADAKDRAWRTFLQGMGIDVAIAVTLVLMLAFTDIKWTAEYWAALGLSVGRTLLQTCVAYVMRVFVGPRLTK